MSTFALKLIALILMFLDHANEFFPNIMPLWFRWVGRFSAPIFFFCIAQGISFTHSRKAYILRLYMSSVVMGIGNLVLIKLFPNSLVPLNNNIFATLFLIAVIITMLDKYDSERKSTPIILFVLLQFVLIFVNILFMALEKDFAGLFTALLPNLLFSEGGAIFIFLACMMYKLRNQRKIFAIMYILFSGYFLFAAIAASAGSFSFSVNYQWMMLGALPIMLAWNKKQGLKAKYLFYVFYPAHIWGLYMLSNLIT